MVATEATGLVGAYSLVLGLAMYLIGSISVVRRMRVQRWRKAMRGEDMDRPFMKSVPEAEASVPKVRRWRRHKTQPMKAAKTKPVDLDP